MALALVSVSFLLSSCQLGDNRISGRYKSIGSTTDLPLPASPAWITATVDNESAITLSWAPAQGADDYIIAYQIGNTPPADCESGTLVLSSQITGTSYQVTGLVEDSTYSFLVCSVNADGVFDSSGGTAAEATPTYCSPSRTNNSPYANSGEAGGTGLDSSTAFGICTATQLNAVGTNSTDYDKFFELRADINMKTISGADFNIIGDLFTPFTGQFNGRNHVIKNLSVFIGGDNAGLFGRTDNAYIQKLHLVNASVKGANNVGLLVGQSGNVTTIRQVSVHGVVRGGSGNIGGLVGRHTGGGTIKDCSAHADVFVILPTFPVGGLVGYASANIDNCLAIGSIQSETSGTGDVGGIVGELDGARLNQSFSIMNILVETSSSAVTPTIGLINGGLTNLVFFDTQSSCTNAGAGSCTFVGSGPQGNTTYGIDTSVQPGYFFDKTNSPMNAWDFEGESVFGTDDLWQEYTNGPPVFSALGGPTSSTYCWENARSTNTPYANSGEAGINGLTEPTAYSICSVGQWYLFTQQPGWSSTHIKLQNHMNFSHWTGNDYTPVGNSTVQAATKLHGQGFSILNLSIESATTYVGLFGYITSNAEINDLHLENVNIKGSQNVGGLVAYSNFSSTINRSSVSGFVGGTGANQDFIGGLIGRGQAGSSINDCYSNVQIEATGSDHGGLAGDFGGLGASPIHRSYSTGTITSSGMSGGIVGIGLIGWSVHDSFSLVQIQGTSGVGPIAGGGVSPATNTVNSFFDTSRTCLDTAGSCNTYGTGIDGPTQPQYFFDKTNAPLDSWDFDTVWKEVPGELPELRNKREL